MSQSRKRITLTRKYADTKKGKSVAGRASKQSNMIRLPAHSAERTSNPLWLEDAVSEFMGSMHGINSPATIKWYEPRLKALVKYFGHIPVQDIQTSELRKWRDTLTNRSSRWDNHPTRPTQPGGLSRWTIHGYVRAVRHFFTWLNDEQMMEHNPVKRFELPILPDEPPKHIAREDMERIIQIAKSDARDYALVRFIASTGARVCGVAGLRWEDVVLASGRATVREKGRGGKGKSRTVYFKSKTREALEKWQEKSHAYAGPVFTSQRGGGALTEVGVYQVIERLAKKAGVTGRSNPHSFRHALAKMLLDNGANLAQVSNMLGHENIQTTIRSYARYVDKELKEAHDRFSPVD